MFFYNRGKSRAILCNTTHTSYVYANIKLKASEDKRGNYNKEYFNCTYKCAEQSREELNNKLSFPTFQPLPSLLQIDGLFLACVVVACGSAFSFAPASKPRPNISSHKMAATLSCSAHTLHDDLTSLTWAPSPSR